MMPPPAERAIGDAAMAYEDTNVFAKILRGEIPSAKLFETEHVVAIMDAMPQSEGHCLVIPKAPSRNILDASDEVLHRTITAVALLARAVKSAFGADGVAVMQFNEMSAGQSVFHLHFHVVPRYEGVETRSHAGGMADPSTLAAQAERIKAAL